MSQLPLATISLRQYAGDANFPVNEHDATFLEYEIPGALLDSGASVSLLSRDVAIKSGLKIETTPRVLLNNAVSSDHTITQHAVRANICLNEDGLEVFDKLLYVVDQLSYKAILGMNTLKGLTIKLESTPLVSINQISTETSVVEVNNVYSEQQITVRARTDTVVNPFTKKWICVYFTMLDRKYKSAPGDIYCDLVQDLRQNGVKHLTRISTGRNQLYLINETPDVIYLNVDAIVATGRDPVEGEEYWLHEEYDETGVARELQNEIRERSGCPLEAGENPEDYEEDISVHDVNTLTEIKDLSRGDRVQHGKDFRRFLKRREELMARVDITPAIDLQVMAAPAVYQETLREVLTKHKIAFSHSATDTGFAEKYCVRLIPKNENDKHPVYASPYKMNSELADKLDDKIQCMINDDLLEETCSAYSSPCMVIRKKDGSLRLINNYSTKDGVNSKLLVTKVPVITTRLLLAKVAMAISKLQKSHPNSTILFSSADLKSAFYSLSIAKSDRPITSFIANWRQVQYCRLSMGLSVAPSMFCRYMSIYFDNIKAKNFSTFTYMDDLLVIAPAEHMAEALETLFRRVEESRMTVSLSKSCFYQQKLTFLGYELSQKGIKAPKAKVDDLIKLDYPATQKHAMRFCGAFNYYLRGAPRIASCLYAIQREIGRGKEKYRLTNAIKVAVDKLRQHVRSGISQNHIDYGTEDDNIVIVAADASLAMWGGFIGNARWRNNELTDIRPCAYTSGVFDAVVMCESSRLRETIAAANVLNEFADLLRPWLPFLLITDHKSLANLKTNQSLGKTIVATRSRKAVATLMSYTNVVLHWLPADHKVIELVDALSRQLDVKTCLERNKVNLDKMAIEELMPSEEVNLIYPLRQESPDIDSQKLLHAQKMDETGVKISAKLELSTEVPKSCNHEGQRYELGGNKIIYRITPKFKKLAWIPERLAREMVELVHIRTLHTGQHKLQKILSQMQVLIPQKTKLVKEVTNNCIFCQMSAKRPHAEVTSKIKPGLTPFSSVSVDLMSVEGYGGSGSTKYVLTFLCKFSLYLDCETLPNKETKTTTKAMIKLLHKYSCYGTTNVQTDNGMEFASKLMAEMMAKLQISKSTISPYNSKGARVERAHESLRSIMRSLDTTAGNLNFHIHLAVSSYNQLPTKVLDWKSPFEVLYGVPSRLPLMELQDRNPINVDDMSTEELALHRFQWYKCLKEQHQNMALRHVEKFAENAYINSDKWYAVGDIVIVWTPKQRISKIDANLATGPYKVDTCVNGSYKLIHTVTGSRACRNHDTVRKLRLYPELEEAIRLKNVVLIRENIIRAISADLTDDDYEVLGRVSVGEDIKEADHEKEVSRYNLRSRAGAKE